MIPLYSEEEFQSTKSRQLLPLQCVQCGNTFYRTKHRICAVLNPNENTTGCYCSVVCASQKRRTAVEVTCKLCEKVFYKVPVNIKKTKNNFCSSSCAGTYSNTHKTKGTRRSKLEAWLEEQLTEKYPNLIFHFNRKDAIESELDIYIPELKLAFELNGIFHYEPIHGSEKLNQIQNNDHRKFAACIEKEISLCIIDVSHLKYFKHSNCVKYLDIITSIIEGGQA